MRILKFIALFLFTSLFVACDKNGGELPLHKDYQNIDVRIVRASVQLNPDIEEEIELHLSQPEYSKCDPAGWDEFKDTGSSIICKKTVKLDTEKRIISFQQRMIVFSLILEDLGKGELRNGTVDVFININGVQKYHHLIRPDEKTAVINYQEGKAPEY